MLWYLPTFYGDIRLESTDKGCLLILEQLTPREQAAVRALRKRALQGGLVKRSWATEGSFPDVIDCEGGYSSIAQYKIDLLAPIGQVQKFLAQELKPGRVLVSAVVFSGGKQIEEVVTDEKPEKKKPEKKPEAAVTVAAPTRGCPQPDFAPAHLKATRVLEAFLTPDQLEDFRTRNSFVAVGADTGHRYLVTSRHAIGDRGQLYDLDERRPWCVHDWDVPAPEEMLGLLVHLSIPGREKYLRDLPE